MIRVRAPQRRHQAPTAQAIAYQQALKQTAALRRSPRLVQRLMGLDTKVWGICDHCRTRTRCWVVDKLVVCRLCACRLQDAGLAFTDLPPFPTVVGRSQASWEAAARHPVTIEAMARFGCAIATRMALGTPEDGSEVAIWRQLDGRLTFDGQPVVETVLLGDGCIVLITRDEQMALMDQELYRLLSQATW